MHSPNLAKGKFFWVGHCRHHHKVIIMFQRLITQVLFLVKGTPFPSHPPWAFYSIPSLLLGEALVILPPSANLTIQAVIMILTITILNQLDIPKPSLKASPLRLSFAITYQYLTPFILQHKDRLVLPAQRMIPNKVLLAVQKLTSQHHPIHWGLISNLCLFSFHQQNGELKRAWVQLVTATQGTCQMPYSADSFSLSLGTLSLGIAYYFGRE